MRVAVVLLQGAVRLYRVAFSPFLAPSCRFYPTCSAYALQALERHGALRGGILTLHRLLRCHPWAGHCCEDPVPERFAWRALIGYKGPRKSHKFCLRHEKTREDSPL